MPLLDDAKNCFVGQTQIKQIYAGTQKVWPKSCLHTDGRPTPLPPLNNQPTSICQMKYSEGGIRFDWSQDFPNISQYSTFQCELFDTISCQWFNAGRPYSQAFSHYQVPKEDVNSFQTYDGRVTGVFSADGSLDEPMYRYSTTFVTIPDRKPPAPSYVILESRTSVLTATYDKGTSDAAGTISKSVGEIRKVGSSDWILQQEAAANINSFSWATGILEPATEYQTRVSTFNQWGQSPWKVSNTVTSP